MRKCLLFACLIATTATAGSETAPPAEEVHVYEGRLLDRGAPVEGVADVTFRVFDLPRDGTQLGATLYAADVVIEDGRFNVTLDFGDFEFDAARHWLEVTVDERTLAPRRRLVQTLDLDPSAGAHLDASDGFESTEPSDGTQSVRAGTFTRGNRADRAQPFISDLLDDSDDEDAPPLTASELDDGGGEDGASGIWNTRGNEYYYKTANVGVGTSNPGYPLDVRSNESRTLNVDNTKSSGTRYGVYARSKSSAGRGVYGYASRSSGTNYGVYGRSNSTSGRGVFGLASAGSGTNYGVFGQSNSADGFSGYFIRNLAIADGNGVRAEFETTPLDGAIDFDLIASNDQPTIAFDSQQGLGPEILIRELDGSREFQFLNNTLTIYSDAGLPQFTFDANNPGPFAVVETTTYGPRNLNLAASTEPWLEDMGSGRLAAGMTRIDLDAIYLETVTIDEEHPMKVFVTLNGDSNGVFVEKGDDHFIVRERSGGQSFASFDYRIVAKRRGLEDDRLERWSEPTYDDVMAAD